MLKRPESVLVVVYTRARDCLLLNRIEPPGLWQSVTGALAWGECHADAAARELREETGLDPTDLRDARVEQRYAILPPWRSRYAPDVTANVEHLWYLELARRVPITIDSSEHCAYEWVPLDSAIERVFSWTNRHALERLRDAHRDSERAR